MGAIAVDTDYLQLSPISGARLLTNSESPYQFERLDNYTLLTLHPLINDGQWGNVSQVGTEILNRLEAMENPSLVVDLSPLDYMGSAQVALLVRIWKSLKTSKGSMAVQCPGETAKAVLATAGLKSVWKIVDTREEALTAVGVRDSYSSNESAPRVGSPVLGIIAVAIAVAAIFLCVFGQKFIPAPASFGVVVVFALASLAAGGTAAILATGFSKWVGATAAVVSVGVFLWAGYQFGKFQKPPVAPHSTPESEVQTDGSESKLPPADKNDGGEISNQKIEAPPSHAPIKRPK